MKKCSYTWKELRAGEPDEKHCEEEIWEGSEKFCIFHDPSPDKSVDLFKEELEKQMKSETDEYHFIGYFFLECGCEFEGQEFGINANFREANFQDANFREANFKNVNFMGANFKNVNFMGATFQDANFMGANFKNANFMGATFQDADFHGATFQSITDFHGATFQGIAKFWEAIFQDADFHGATFQGIADFNRATFKILGNFNRATFQGIADFNRATFKKDADFNRATFKKDADFMRATFKKDADFMRATFQDADFRETTFQDADFRETTFKGTIGFKRVTFKKLDLKSKNIKKLDLRYSEFLSRSYIAVNLKETLFYRSYLYNVDFFDSNWPKNMIIYEKKHMNDKGIDLSYRQLGTIYRDLKQNMQNHGDYAKAGEFYYKEMECKKKSMRKKRFSVHWFKSYVYSLLKYTCGYGEKPERVILSSGLIIFVAAVLFALKGIVIGEFTPEERILNYNLCFSIPGIQTIKDFGLCLYYSFVTFTTLGYGDIHPVGVSKIIACAEAFTGAFFIALFVLVFARKMMR